MSRFENEMFMKKVYKEKTPSFPTWCFPERLFVLKMKTNTIMKKFLYYLFHYDWKPLINIQNLYV